MEPTKSDDSKDGVYVASNIYEAGTTAEYLLPCLTCFDPIPTSRIVNNAYGPEHNTYFWLRRMGHYWANKVGSSNMQFIQFLPIVVLVLVIIFTVFGTSWISIHLVSLLCIMICLWELLPLNPTPIFPVYFLEKRTMSNYGTALSAVLVYCIVIYTIFSFIEFYQLTNQNESVLFSYFPQLVSLLSFVLPIVGTCFLLFDTMWISVPMSVPVNPAFNIESKETALQNVRAALVKNKELHSGRELDRIIKVYKNGGGYTREG